MQFESRDLCQIIETISTVMFGCEVQTRCLAVTSPRAAGDLTGVVPISGAWNGAVALECSADLSRQAASVMFDTQPELITVDHIHDAVGELTNIVAGNFKTLLSGCSHLGLPTVAEGEDYGLRYPGSRTVVQIAVETPMFPFLVTVLTDVECGETSGGSSDCEHEQTATTVSR